MTRKTNVVDGYDGPGAMLAKLRREIEHLSKARKHFEVLDIATNGAITAWHLSDWVLTYAKSNAALMAAACVDLTAHEKEQVFCFADYVEKCDTTGALKLCRTVCNTVKHVRLQPVASGSDRGRQSRRALPRTSATDDPNYRPQYHEMQFYAAPPEDDRPTKEQVTGQRWIAKYGDGPNAKSALDTLNDAYKFWQDFLEQHRLTP